MSFTSYRAVTDPKVMRALAHPARTAILNYLQEEGPATATECAEAAEESPSACSYHLRRLAEFGFVEEVPSNDGRERRWRALVGGYGVPKEAQDRPEVLAALRPLTRRWMEDNQRVIGDYLANEHRFQPHWRKAATFKQTNPRVTPEELVRIGEQIQKVLDPYWERENAPEGAERVNITFVAVPWPVTSHMAKAENTKGRGRGRR
jgi:DNA-binding transcriptional ArsR family regulator